MILVDRLTRAARRTLERLSHGVVLPRKLPPELGGHRIFVAPDASLRFWFSPPYAVDPLLLALARELVGSGDTVWDVGANLGLFSFAASGFAGQAGNVLALEPDPWLANLVQRSASGLSKTFAPIEVLQMAVSNATGTATFAVAARARAASHLEMVPGSSQSGGTRLRLKVPVTTLDHLLETHRAPTLVKIDVEGAELLCLRGADRLLTDVRPAIVCEISTENSAEVAALFRRFDYELADATVAPDARVRLESPTWNTLATPAGGRRPPLNRTPGTG